MSPELLDPDRFGSEGGRPTKESDYYALGMVILEVLSGQAPFPRDGGLVVMRKVIEGERPGRPQGPEGTWFTDDLWETLGQCWSPRPKDRPTVETVFECLERVSVTWQPLPPSADSDVEMADADDKSCLTVGGSGMFSRSLQVPDSPQNFGPSTAGSLTQGLSGIITAESIDASPPSQVNLFGLSEGSGLFHASSHFD